MYAFSHSRSLVEFDVSSGLDHLLRCIEPPTESNAALRFTFGLQCAGRVEHLLEDPQVLSCLTKFRTAVEDGSHDGLASLAGEAARLASAHPGSRSLDGVGHAAVSAAYAVANAIAGRARQASEYAAYAAVYGRGGYGATSDPEAFLPEYEWQAATLQALLSGGAASSETP